MKPTLLAGFVIGILVIASLGTVAQAPTPIPSVWLQSSTPGITQTGNFSISGTGIGGRFIAQGSSANAGIIQATNTANNQARAIEGISTGDGIVFTNYAGYFTAAGSNGVGVLGSATSATGSARGGSFFSSSTGGTAVHAWASASTGSTYGGYFECSSSGGRAVYGVAANNSGSTYGGYFENESISGRGVYANASAPTGTTYGGMFSSASSSGIGVYGLAFATSGATFGGRFEVNSTSGNAIRADADATTGTTYGLFATNASTAGYGVFGEITATTGVNYAIAGETASTSGYGVHGTSPIYGVRGMATGGGVSTAYGVRGSASGGTTTNWGVYSVGDLGAGGTKSFNIDYPLDPTNKWLRHYCAEGPEPMNEYSGTVVTDAKGEAWVQLPDYFEEINRNLRYTLTIVDDSDSDLFVQAKVAREVRDNRFKIRTSAPNVKVSWEVKGVRNDPWVKAHPTHDLVDKGPGDKGKYEHPELYGHGDEMAMEPVAAKKKRS